jgi:uncharacterized membrane protein YqjE
VAVSVERHNGARGIGTLLRDLVEGSTQLVRDEVALARLEAAAIVQAVATGTSLVAIGAVFAALGVLSLIVGVVLLVGDQWLPADAYWLAALILFAITGAVAIWFVKRGMSLVSARELAPTETVTTLKEDKEWLKRRLTSGATSS